MHLICLLFSCIAALTGCGRDEPPEPQVVAFITVLCPPEWGVTARTASMAVDWGDMPAAPDAEIFLELAQPNLDEEKKEIYDEPF